MWTALITGLAALTGAAIGGLVTVWATHKTNVAAAQRERDQRLHDHSVAQYQEAKSLISEFLSTWIDSVADNYRQPQKHTFVELANVGAKIQLILPDLEDEVGRMVHATEKDKVDSLGSRRDTFLKSAREELKKLEPKG